MPERKSNLLIPAIGATVLVAGGVAAYMYFQGPSGDSSDALGSAKLVPSTALMATYITTDPQAWAKLDQFGTPESQKLLAKGLEDFKQDFFSAGNISYEQDIQPWVGGVMLAVLPANPTKLAQSSQPNSSPQRQPEPNILMVVGIKDKLNALSFANKLKAQKGVKVQESNYKGETITETTGNSRPTYSAVLNNNHLVVAPERQSVENAIDTFKGQPSFANQEGANAILTANADVQNILAQVYIPDYAGMVQKLLAANPQSSQLPPKSLTQLKQIKSVVARVGVDDQGLRMKAIANLDPQLNKFEYQTTPANIVKQLPSDTFALITGNGISRSWTTIVEESQDYPEFNQILQQVRGQLKFVNIDLDKDVFGWMDQEFAFGAMPSNQGMLASLGFGGALIFQTSDRQTATATLSKLDNLAKTQQLSISKRNIGGKDVTEWQIPRQGALLSHGWLDQNTVFLALGGSVAEAIASTNTAKLDSSDNFKAVTGSLQTPNAGYFYIDVDKTTSLVNRFVAQRQPLPSQANTVLSSIRGLGVTVTSPNKSTSQLEMLLALKPQTVK
ncbi:MULTISPECIES: DUF3352 domain-containing protein [unclassified Anabaena]|uniref:DUF3352 domain-containing protein n=1 Tax=unclassified Anabaena TaxID=2619674 RepID=UPI0039C71850